MSDSIDTPQAQRTDTTGDSEQVDHGEGLAERVEMVGACIEIAGRLVAVARSALSAHLPGVRPVSVPATCTQNSCVDMPKVRNGSRGARFSRAIPGGC